jgi:hypothetical protein
MSNKELSDIVTANYLLVNVVIRTYGGERIDRTVSDDIHRLNNASRSTGKYTRFLFGEKCSELKAVGAAYNAMRNYMYRNTLPWVSDASGAAKGDRLLPVDKSMEFLAEFATMRAAARDLRDAMAADLPAIIDRVRAEMGTMPPDLSEYPSADEFKRRFDAVMEINPVPAVTDFSRLAVPGVLAGKLQGVYEQRMQNQMKNAQDDAIVRVGAALNTLRTKLLRLEAGENIRLHAALLENLSRENSLLGAITTHDNQEVATTSATIFNDILKTFTSVDMFKTNASACKHVISACEVALSGLGISAEQVTVVPNEAKAKVVVEEPAPEPTVDEKAEEELDDMLAELMGLPAIKELPADEALDVELIDVLIDGEPTGQVDVVLSDAMVTALQSPEPSKKEQTQIMQGLAHTFAVQDFDPNVDPDDFLL